MGSTVAPGHTYPRRWIEAHMSRHARGGKVVVDLGAPVAVGDERGRNIEHRAVVANAEREFGRPTRKVTTGTSAPLRHHAQQQMDVARVDRHVLVSRIRWTEPAVVRVDH